MGFVVTSFFVFSQVKWLPDYGTGLKFKGFLTFLELVMKAKLISVLSVIPKQSIIIEVISFAYKVVLLKLMVALEEKW